MSVKRLIQILTVSGGVLLCVMVGMLYRKTIAFQDVALARESLASLCTVLQTAAWGADSLFGSENERILFLEKRIRYLELDSFIIEHEIYIDTMRLTLPDSRPLMRGQIKGKAFSFTRDELKPR